MDKEYAIQKGLLPFCNSCSKPYFDWFGICIITAVVNEYNEVALLRQSYVSSTNCSSSRLCKSRERWRMQL